ncbi:MAG: HAMP domain-containing sensor histidine kinase [Chitinophagales bacterium]|nr:HAMP domain-containing sensor histidine kinase [Chitinophagales bacterium]
MAGILLFALLPLMLITILIIGGQRYVLLHKQVKELQKLNEAKDRLFTVIGHDLNSTIKSVQPTIELYRHENTSEEERRFLLDSIEENAVSAVEMLQGLLEWGKSQIKGITLSPTYFNASDVIKSKLNLFKVSIRNKGITIVNKLPPETTIYADSNHFRFVLRNLLINAIKFTRINGTVEINAIKYHQPEYVIFSVKDNGTGIEKERLKQIFEPFNTSIDGTRNEKGNGIGLLLCREFIKVNGGQIWAESEAGEGTTFFVALKTFEHSKPLIPLHQNEKKTR